MKHANHLLHILGFTAAMLLVGCNKPTPEATPPAEPASADSTKAPPAESTPQGDPDKKLNLFCWSEYVPQSVIDQFSEETGISVTVENYASNEEMLAKLLAGGGNYDLIQPSEYIVAALIKENLLAPLDKDRIPNLKNVAPEFLDRPFDPGNTYSVPYMAGLVGIIVNSETVTDEIKGFSDVFQDKHKGRIVVLDDAREIVSWAMATEGIPINEMSDENLEKVRPKLMQWLPLVKVYDSDSPKTSLLSGDVDLGVVWSGEGAILLNEDKKFKWIVPEEGTHLFIDSLAIPKSAEHKKNAELFINFVLRPEISKQISDAFPYLNPNLEARKLLSAEQLGNAASFPPSEVVQKLVTFDDIGPQAAKVDEIVTSIKVQ